MAKGKKLQSVGWAEEAAKGSTHAERMKWIEEHVPANYQALVRDYLVDLLAVRIFDLPTKEARRAAIEDIPLDCDPPWARSLIQCRVLDMWKNRKIAA